LLTARWDSGGSGRGPRLRAGRAATAPRTNLRAQITSFVGRADDIARITDVLDHARLVTLTGPGGAGKTRLAGEAAAHARADARRRLDGRARVRRRPGRPAAGRAVGDKHLLLLVDNCEHLIADVAALVDRLLGRCPALRVLATSREPLGITGEVLQPVGPLAMPEGSVTPAEALRYPALRLFADRAAAVRPAFAVDDANLPSVLRICRALDGIPLAIGLAADEVLYLLAALVDKSLVVAGQDEPSGEIRFSMLETVRAYGEERRRDAGEDQALRRAHADYFLELTERAEPRLRLADQLTWIARLSAERDNLPASLRWAVDSQDATLTLRLVGALGWYWFLRSARAEASEWAEKALALPGEAPPTVRAQALVARAFIALSGGSDMPRAMECIDEAMGIVRGLSAAEQRTLPSMLTFLPAMTAIFHNEDTVALERVRDLWEHPDPWVRAFSRTFGSGLLLNQGEVSSGAGTPAGRAGPTPPR